MRPFSLFVFVLALALAACNGRGSRGGGGDDDSGAGDDDGADDDSQADDDGSDDDTVNCPSEGETECHGTQWVECLDGLWITQEVCASPQPDCDPILGCTGCTPNSSWCSGEEIWSCPPDGEEPFFVETCPSGSSCLAGECITACDLAAQQNSYLGCRFLAIATANSQLPVGFVNDFAVVIGVPPGLAPANVTISMGSSVVASQQISAGQTAAITLSMHPVLQYALDHSVVETDAAYEVSSDVPVVAYQFNPLHFSTGWEYSYTNDASLLLPEHTLSENYRALTWNTFSTSGFTFRGFMAIAATEDNTTVTLTSSTTTAGGTPSQLSAGQSTSFLLNRGDVAQVMSGDSVSHDLSGSTISATAPVAMVTGHDCTFMPPEQWACDHLEEMAFPLETWGTTVVISALAHPDGSGIATSRYRVLADLPGTTVSFEPAVQSSVTLNAGEFVQFDASQDFEITSNNRISVMQAMWGQDALGALTGGDPAMGTGIPWSQTRSSYDFLVPDSYTTNWLNVVAPAGTNVEYDGSPVSGWTTIGTSGYEAVRLPVNPGSHRVVAPGGERFGITAYGYASYTSYLYPGGLNLLR